MERFAAFALQGDDKPVSGSAAFVQQLAALAKDADIGSHIVPILADASADSDTAELFKQFGLDARADPDSNTDPTARSPSARADADADALATWIDAATRHATHGQALMPFHISTSGFGFRDIGNLMGAASDARARGFLIRLGSSGSASHHAKDPRFADIASHLFASTLAHCRAYHPAFASELAVIVDHGLRRMLMNQYDEFYYVTVAGEPIATPDLPASAHADVIRGMHLLQTGAGHEKRVQLLGSGATMPEVLRAAARLDQDHGIAADVWSVTSYLALAREGIEQERRWRNASRAAVDSWLEQRLAPTAGPIVAASDHGRSLPELLRAFMPPGRRYITLGAADSGGDDMRADEVRTGEVRTDHMRTNIDASTIVQASLRAVDEISCTERSAERRKLAAVMSLSSI